MKPQDFIPTPCHEDWNQMSGSEKQRFCNKCTTHVHDLTDMNTEEILALKVQNGGKLCGSFRIKRPLAIGASLATLALASCDKDKTSTDQSQQPAHKTPKEQKVTPKHTPKTVQLDPVMGIVCEPMQPKQTPRIAPKHVPQLLGEVCEPFPEVKPPKQSRKMGKIVAPPKEHQ